MSLASWVTSFIPDDSATPADRRNWRKRVALVACSSWLFLFLALTPSLAGLFFTGVPVLGRVAYADEVDRKIDAKVAAAVRPLETAVSKLDASMQEQKALLSEQVTSSIASQICRYGARREKETDIEERRRIALLLSDLKRKYRQYAGLEFDVRDC